MSRHWSSLCLCRFAAIHAEAPEFIEMSVEQEILVTGIKVVDLLAPYAKGGKIGMLVVGTYFPNSVERKKIPPCYEWILRIYSSLMNSF